MKILLTNAGRRTYFVEFILECSTNSGTPQIYVGDCTNEAPALYVSDRAVNVLLPPVLTDERKYVEAVIGFARSRSIDLIIPLSDLDLEVLARSKDQFRNFGCHVAVSDPITIETCMDKRLAYEFCIANQIGTPDSFFSVEEFDGVYPAIRKLIRGSGSADLRIVRSPDDLPGFESGLHFIQSFVEGVEYGLDILNDFDGRFVRAVAKKKLAMRAGETDRAAIVDHVGLQSLGRELSEKFRHVGNLDVDVMESRDGRLYCLDFNPRFGGGYPATHLAGMNYLQALIDMAAGTAPALPAAPRMVTVLKGISLHVMRDGL